MKERTYVTVEEARAMLPKVGDRLMRVPSQHSDYVGLLSAKPMPCVVTYVHRENLWYSVRFDNFGYTEGYKVPPVGREVRQ